jgi:hypothetical protein
MPLPFVYQEQKGGCFIACAAMLLRLPYREIFDKIHPGIPFDKWGGGINTRSVMDEARSTLESLNIQVTPGRARRFKSIQQHSKRHAVIIIRWRWQPWICHTILFDAEARKFIDPLSKLYNRWTLQELEDQLEGVLYVDKIPIQSAAMKDAVYHHYLTRK